MNVNQPFEDFMAGARAEWRARQFGERVSKSLHQQGEAARAAWFWTNFQKGLRRILPAAIADYLPQIDTSFPIARHPVFTLLLPACLEIRVSFWCDENGLPSLRDSNPFLVPGIDIHLGQMDLIWTVEIGALYQPVWVDNLAVAAAMAEERCQRLSPLGLSDPHPGRDELHYVDDPQLNEGVARQYDDDGRQSDEWRPRGG